MTYLPPLRGVRSPTLSAHILFNSMGLLELGCRKEINIILSQKAKQILLSFSGTVLMIVRAWSESFSIIVRINQTAVVASCRSILKCIIKETRILSAANVRGSSTK